MLPHTIDVTIKGDRSYEAAGAAVMTHVPRRRLCFFLPHIFSQSLPLQAACIFSLDRQLSQFRAQTLHFFAYYPRTLTFLPWRDAPFISSALRIRTIYGGLEPSLKLSFEACHQQGHQKKWR